MSSAAFRRIIRLQRQILKTIRADVRKALGPQTRDIRRYYEAYKREFHGAARHSTKEELLKACIKSQLIFLGDYHTFAQSQKAALRLLRELVSWDAKLTLGLEMVPAICQPVLNDFMRGELEEKEFLEKIDYDRNWGFNWEHFRPLFVFAREHGLEVIGLNVDSPDLGVRDAGAAEVIAGWTRRNPKRRLFVLYGDLHLARGHIPKFLRAELGRLELRRKTVTIFQNSESLYWRLAESRMAHTVDVLALGRGRYCIMNAAPWVKLQSYLEWAEASELLDAEDGAGPNLADITHERLKHLAEALGLKLPENLDFTVQTINDLSFLANRSSAFANLSRGQIKAIKYHILGNRTVFIPGANIVYLASTSVNAISEGVALLARAAVSRSPMLYYDPREHFFAAVLNSTLAYFGSKMLNHKRKCDLEEDFRLLLEHRAARTALPREKLQRRVARLVLRHCQASREYLRTKRYRAALSQPGPGRIALLLETSRALGGILGEKLYAGFVEGRYPTAKLEKLFCRRLASARQSRKLYLELVADLESAPLAHTSKLDLL